MKKLSLIVGAILGSSLPAYASTVVDTSQTYTSSLLVWLFLGFCAMLVVCQIIPSMLLLFGMLKGVFVSEKRQAKEIASE